MIRALLFVWTLCGGQLLLEAVVYEKYVHEIVNPFVRDMQREYGLICVGSGGTMPRNVEEISVHFYLYRRTALEEARELVIKLKEDLVSR